MMLKKYAPLIPALGLILLLTYSTATFWLTSVSSVKTATSTYGLTPTITFTNKLTATPAAPILTPTPNLTTTAETQATQTAITQLQQTSTAIAVTVEAMQLPQTAIANQNETATARSFTPTPTLPPIPTSTVLPLTLISPPDGATFSGPEADILLEWTWAGELRENEYFFIEARFSGSDNRQVCREGWQYFAWTKELSLQVEPWLYDIMCPGLNQRIVTWQISVAEPLASLSNPEGTIRQKSIQKWRFQWLLSSGNPDGNPAGNATPTIPAIIIPPAP